jgi:hypothetical protein
LVNVHVVSPTVVVDARNVLRSRWPNIRDQELVDLAREWAERNGLEVLLVFDGSAPEQADDVVGTGRESADDWIAREVLLYAPYWLVTSDRELRRRAGTGAERVIGGGSFAGELTR